MRSDLLVVDQPVGVPRRAVGGIGREPRRLDVEALLGAVNHGLGRTHLGLADGAGGFDIHDDAELHVDEIIVGVGEERRALEGASPSEGDTNFGVTALAAPKAA